MYLNLQDAIERDYREKLNALTLTFENFKEDESATDKRRDEMGNILNCRICGKLMKRSRVIHKVYPEDYDASCCNDCNIKAANED